MKGKKLVYAAKELGKFMLEPFYSFRDSGVDVMKFYSGPALATGIAMTALEVASFAATGKPIDLSSKMSPIALYALVPPITGLIVGHTSTALYLHKETKKLKTKRERMEGR